MLSTIFLDLFGFVFWRLEAAASGSDGSSAAFGEGVTNGGAANGGASSMSSKRAMLSVGGRTERPHRCQRRRCRRRRRGRRRSSRPPSERGRSRNAVAAMACNLTSSFAGKPHPTRRGCCCDLNPSFLMERRMTEPRQRNRDEAGTTWRRHGLYILIP